MSKIALLIKDFGPKKADAVAALRTALGVGLASINQAVTNGTPLVEKSLFDRQEPDFPDRLLGLMLRLDSIGTDWAAYEVLNSQTYSSTMKFYQLDAHSLKNMIDARRVSLEQQVSLGQLQDGST